MKSHIYIFAGGGTGGHLYPGLAVAEQLTGLDGEAKIIFACSNRAIDSRILADQPYGMVVQPIRPAPRRMGQVLGFAGSWFASRSLARQMIADLRPAAVLGLGGFAAAPVVRQAAEAGVAAAMLSIDAVVGKANRYLAGFTDTIFTQFGRTVGCYRPADRGKVVHVGCPIRRAFAEADRAEALRYFELREDRKTLLVVGGSLGAAAINEAVDGLADYLQSLGGRWQMLHIAGPGKASPPPAERMHTHRLEYCHRMDLAYAAADLAICRGGAVTTAELAATATPAVIMPYPHHADQQQLHNAAELVEAGAAVICEDRLDAAVNADALGKVLAGLMDDDDQLDRMRESAANPARPDAARAIAAWLAEQTL